MIKRSLEKGILNRLDDEKIIIIYGARQVGKTTLLRKLFENESDVLWLNGDEAHSHALLSDSNSERFKAIIGKNRFLVIDEAQRIPELQG